MDVTIPVENETRVYTLNEDAQTYLKDVARSAYSENEFTNVWIETYSDTFKQNYPHYDDARTQIGDVIVVIETEGHVMPAEHVVQPQEQQSIDAMDMKQMEGDDDVVDEDDESSPTSKLDTLLPNKKESDEKDYTLAKYVEELVETREQQIENGRMPRAPVEEDKVPQLVQLVPELDGESWQTSKAMFPTSGFYFRNVQERIDYPVQLLDESLEDARTRTRMSFATLFDQLDCEYDTPSDTESKTPHQYSKNDVDEEVSEGAVGNRWI